MHLFLSCSGAAKNTFENSAAEKKALVQANNFDEVWSILLWVALPFDVHGA